MLINPIVANLHNLKTDHFHPILFQEVPQPSWATGSSLVRSKSVGHHTAGFQARDEALVECKKIAEGQNARLCVAKDFAWDGEDTPAMVVFFGEKDGLIEPMF